MVASLIEDTPRNAGNYCHYLHDQKETRIVDWQVPASGKGNRLAVYKFGEGEDKPKDYRKDGPLWK